MRWSTPTFLNQRRQGALPANRYRGRTGVRMTRDASDPPADAASRLCVSVAAVAAVVAPVGAAVVATVDSVGDDHGPTDGGGGPAPASCCQWHVRLLPSCLRA